MMNMTDNNARLVVANNARYCCAYTVLDGDTLERDPFALKRAVEAADRYYRTHEPDALPVVAMTWDQFEAFERERILAKGELQRATEEQVEQAFSVLPPLRIRSNGPLTTFFLGEAFHGPYYTQYATLEVDGRRIYASKMASIRDESTWITVADVIRANTEEPSA